MMQDLKGTVVVPSTTLVRTLPDGDSVILDLESERYFGLDVTGTAMWDALTTGQSIAQAGAALLDRFEVEEERLQEDLAQLVAKLESLGLIEVR